MRNMDMVKRRQALQSLLVLQIGLFGVEYSLHRPVRDMKKEFQHRYLDHLNDVQLDGMMQRQGFTGF